MLKPKRGMGSVSGGPGCVALAALFLGILAVAAVVGAAIVSAVWAWVVPDVFAGAVEHGVLPAALTYMQALKLSILLSVLGLTYVGTSRSK